MKKIYIGIDAGINTGISVWGGNKLRYFTGDFWKAIETIEQFNIKVEIEVIIEDPSLNKPVFIDKYKKQNILVALKIGQNIGGNKKEALLLISYCEKNNIKYRAVRPSTKKWDKAMLKTITGITTRTNEHERDAIKLVYGL